MRTVIEEFEKKAEEVRRYFVFLKKLEEPHVCLYFPDKVTHKRKEIDDGTYKFLKANAFLILYNLIESTITSGLSRTYELIRDEGCSYQILRDDLKKLWISSGYRAIDQKSATMLAYQAKAEELINQAVGEAVVQLSHRFTTRMSGNLDANRIRKICGQHGISYITPAYTNGGVQLEVVRKKRNGLAHGYESFDEVGRNFTPEQLDGIRKEVVLFLRSILRNMNRYSEKKEYLAQS